MWALASWVVIRNPISTKRLVQEFKGVLSTFRRAGMPESECTQHIVVSVELRLGDFPLIAETLKPKSLILAQIERWRHA